MSKKIKVLLFASHYLPGYKAGGPIKTINNMVESLCGDVEFWIVTRDRDLGANMPYANIDSAEWSDVGAAKVMYLQPNQLGLLSLSKVIKETPADVIYLNSFFDFAFSIKVLIALKFRMYLNTPIVLAPRGEFSRGALNLKARKKKLYIKLAGLLRLYKSVVWQASTEDEKVDIVNSMAVSDEFVFLAKDLPGAYETSDTNNLHVHENNFGLKIIFLSRISPMKNLDYAVKVLSEVTREVDFDIFGPKEDKAYWKKCHELIDELPENINARYIGEVCPNEVKETFERYDLFLFPTRGENYGHVISESLSVGTPVLLSDQTPWKGLFEDGLGWNFSLNNPECFVEVIENLLFENKADRKVYRDKVRLHAIKRIYSNKDLEDNRKLFEYALSLSGQSESKD